MKTPRRERRKDAWGTSGVKCTLDSFKIRLGGRYLKMHFEETKDYLIAHNVHVGNRTVNVVIERQALPPYASETDLLVEWVEKYAVEAVRNDDMGDQRYLDFYPDNQCGWIYRVLHNNGDISINKTPAN